MHAIGEFVRWAVSLPVDPRQGESCSRTVLELAGFDCAEVKPGKLRGKFRDQGGDPTGETYAINETCPLKSVNSEGDDDYRATGWLDAIFRFASDSFSQGVGLPDVVDRVKIKIEESVPLKPIVLSAIGDELHEYPPDINIMSGYFVRHTRDDREMSLAAGVHAVCNSFVDRKEVTKSHDALICRGCRLRVPFPKGIKTYGDLRQHFAQFNAA